MTASTLGYGDLIPSTHASRVFSVFVVLLGFGVLSFVTAAIAATFVESAGAAHASARSCTTCTPAGVKALHTEAGKPARGNAPALGFS